MREKKLVIADGHHRYETALNYRNEHREKAPLLAKDARNGAPVKSLLVMGRDFHTDDKDAPYEFVMMTFVNMNDPGLLILPTHRVVHSLAEFSADEFAQAADEFYEVEEVKAEIEAKCASALLKERRKNGTALLAVTAARAFVLHSPKAATAKFLDGLSERQRGLDVVQLHKCLLEGVLKLSEESIRNQQNLSYLRDADEAMTMVRNGGANVAFLMNPCSVHTVWDVALAGEVMPQKSTDFYPKLLSGLAAYALE
jgi:uncharacterized protein (DUF1015 family)